MNISIVRSAAVCRCVLFLLGSFAGLPAGAAPVYEVIKSVGNPGQMGHVPVSAPVEGSDGFLYGATYYGGIRDLGVIYRVARDGSRYTVLHHFQGPDAGSSSNVDGRLVQGLDGRFYGAGYRTIFAINPDGSGFTVLKLFAASGTDPQEMRDGLLAASDGRLYGVSRAGGTAGTGTVFRLNTDGSGFTVIRSLAGTGTNVEPRRPSGTLLEASDGMIYGTSLNGGVNDRGTIFRFYKNGTGWQVLRSFSNSSTSAVSPKGALVEGPDRVLYGLADGGPEGDGVVYRINRDGSSYGVIKSWGYTSGGIYRPGQNLSISEGVLYGTCIAGGSGSHGGVFRVSRTGTEYQEIVAFPYYGIDAAAPATGLVHGSDGLLYGAGGGDTSFFPGTIWRAGKTGTGYTVVRVFSATGGEADQPEHVVDGADKNLYISTDEGGKGPGASLFRIRREGSGYQTMHTYREGSSLNREPAQGLIQASDGNFYGTSYYGGASDQGAVLRLSNGGTEYRAIYSFNTWNNPGNPSTLPLEGSDGFLYGYARGSLIGGPSMGVIWKMTKSGTGFSVIRQFAGGTGDTRDGSAPLIEGSDGKLYGVTSTAVITIGRDGTGYRVLKSFNYNDGGPYNLYDALLEGSDRVLYGVATYGGTSNGGCVFRINRDGSGFAVMQSFTSAGGRPSSALVEGTDGRLYGVTQPDQAYAAPYGTLYALNKNGSGFAVLHGFGTAAGDGQLPGSLIRGRDGMLYGTTKSGGAYRFGTVFRYGEAPEITVLNTEGSELTGGVSAVDAGSVRTGTENIVTLTVRNDGQLPLHSFSLNFTGDQSGDFSAVSLPSQIAPGASAVAEIRFKPSRPGSRSTLVQLRSNDYDESPFTFNLYGTGLAPELSLRQGETPVTDGQDGVIDYGVTRQPDPVTRSFVIRNSGTAPLVLERLTPPAGYSLKGPYLHTLAPGQTVSFDAVLEAAAPGVYAGRVVIESDAFASPVFDFPVTGTVITPEIEVFAGTAGGVPLTHDQADVIDFGTVRQASPEFRAFTLRNAGTAPLLVQAVEVPAGFTAMEVPDLPFALVSGGTLTFRLRIDAAGTGEFPGTVRIASDDLDEPVFVFPVTGRVVTPEIRVLAGEAELADGQTAPVDFGRNIQGTPGVRTFTIANTGTAPLLVSGVAVPSGYALPGLPALPLMIAAGESAGFAVHLTTLTPGGHGGPVVILSDDLDEGAFTFPLSGDVYIPDPEAAGIPATAALQRQTGLLSQTVHLRNDTTATVPAAFLVIRGLPSGVEVFNASEIRADGSFAVYLRQSMPPHSSMDVTLEFYAPGRNFAFPAPQFSTEVVLEPFDLAAAGSVPGLTIERLVRLDGGDMLLEFPSEPGVRYEIQYSGDGRAWEVSLPAVRAAGNRLQWIDRGLPRTAGHPSASPSRFYRVKRLGP